MAKSGGSQVSDQLQEALEYCESGLAKSATDPRPLRALAEEFVDLPLEDFDDALRRFFTSADGYFTTTDSDYGGLLLEHIADGLPSGERQRRLYDSALLRCSILPLGPPRAAKEPRG